MLQLFNNNNNKENSRDYFRERSNTSLLKRILFNKNIVSDSSIDKLEKYNIIKTNENTITLLNKIDNDIYQIYNITLRKNDILRQIIDAFNNTDDDGLLSLLRRRLRDARTRAVRRASRGSSRRANVRVNNRSSRTQTNQQKPQTNNKAPRQAQSNAVETNRVQQTQRAPQQAPRAQQAPQPVQPPNTSQAPASRLPTAPTTPLTTTPSTPTTPSTTQVAPRPVAPTVPQSVTPPAASVTPPITPPTSQAPTAPAAPQVTPRPAAPVTTSTPQAPTITAVTPSITPPPTTTPTTSTTTQVTTAQTTTPTQTSSRNRRHRIHQSRVPNNETIRQIATRHASNGFNSILRIIPFLSATIAGANEYEETQDAARAAAVGAGHLGGTYAGAALGASIGSVVPGVGTLIGGLAGGILGSYFGEEFARTIYDIMKEHGDEGIERLRGAIRDVNKQVENNSTANTLFSELEQFLDLESARIKAQEERARTEIDELLRQGENDGLIEKEKAQEIHDAMNKRELSLETIRNNLQNELERIRQEREQNALKREQERITENIEDGQRIQEVNINNLNDLINAINQYIDDPNERARFLNMARRRHARLQPLIATINSFLSESNKKIRFTYNMRLSSNINALPTENSLLALTSLNLVNDDVEFDKFVKEQKKQSRIAEKEQEQRLHENDIINFLNNNTFNEITFEAEELFFDGNISALIELLAYAINENQVTKIPNQLIPTQQNENPVAVQTAIEVEKVLQNNQTFEVQRTYTSENSTAQVNENNYNQENISENEPNEMAELQQQPGQNNELTRENTQQFSELNNQQTNENANQNISQNDFMAEVNRVSNKFGINPNDLLALMRSESSLNPQAVNPTTGATGLIQFMPKTARSLGTTVEELRNMSAAQQMRFVEKYFESVNLPRGASAGTLYAYVFLPGRAQRQILAQAGESFYEANRGLDMNRDGMITIEDLNMRMARYGGTINRESTRMVANNQARLRRNDTNIIINTAQNSMPQENNQIIKNDNTMRREVSLLQRLEKLTLVQA